MDDGLGVSLASEIGNWARRNNIANVHTDTNYQLNIEDAEIIRDFEIVVFADASTEEVKENVLLTRLDGNNELTFTTHAASPGYVVHLCNHLFGCKPEAYLLHIKGYE